jgi:hypothetical protein
MNDWKVIQGHQTISQEHEISKQCRKTKYAISKEYGGVLLLIGPGNP